VTGKRDKFVVSETPRALSLLAFARSVFIVNKCVDKAGMV